MELIIEHLSKSFGGRSVLRDLSFRFQEGKIYGLLGRNGAGKTTLMNCINGDLAADTGCFCLEVGEDQLVLRPEDVGYVISTPTVPEFLTGREFLKFFLEINASSIPAPRSLEEYFDLVRLQPADRDRLMKDYSHGMKNKMQMLVNIICEPKLLMLDEPLTSLDVVVAEEMKQLLRSLRSGRITLFSTHLLDLALDLCDEIVLRNHGRLERVEKSDLDRGDLKARILDALREDCHA